MRRIVDHCEDTTNVRLPSQLLDQLYQSSGESLVVVRSIDHSEEQLARSSEQLFVEQIHRLEEIHHPLPNVVLEQRQILFGEERLHEAQLRLRLFDEHEQFELHRNIAQFDDQTRHDSRQIIVADRHSLGCLQDEVDVLVDVRR